MNSNRISNGLDNKHEDYPTLASFKDSFETTEYKPSFSKIVTQPCPYCLTNQVLEVSIKHVHLEDHQAEVNRVCQKCGKSYIEFYTIGRNESNESGFEKFKTLSTKSTDHKMTDRDHIRHFVKTGEKTVFSRFEKYYSEAGNASKQGLSEAYGMLLRKSLEALIIDYIRFGLKVKGKTNIPEYKQLDTMGLMKCVELIEDPSLKELTRRATWIGNDNVHTKRKWIDFGTVDLERLLAAIVLNIYSKIECLIYMNKMK